MKTIAQNSLRTFAAALLAVLCSACAHHTPPASPQNEAEAQDQGPKPGGDFLYLLDRKSPWKEDKVDTLPPLPQDKHLLPFEVSASSTLSYAIDAPSVSVGKDGVVRYAVVITSPQGARNVNYEGIRCDTYEWRSYAAIDENGDAWDRGAAFGWRRIEQGQLNAYHAALYQDFMCANRLPTGSAKQIVENIRYKRIAADQYH